ncbi:hypothetical protein JRI60_39615 [Archangium violaceum]|uniref:hypothetical protein n=1 Tax=Archangium violaceum TaxID=83451 RepID=UPI00194E4D0F|nr:hypothetical protein [Archangium violaceum]QRN95141.1 hypothetical protein JRI60_39615 [Archangium violaceum]
MFPLVLALLVAQTPALADEIEAKGLVVMVSRYEGLTPIEAVTLADRLSKALQNANVPVAMDALEVTSQLGEQRSPASCQGKPECFAKLGRELGVAAVVIIDSSKVFDDLPMRIVLLDTQEGQTVFKRSYTASALRPAELDLAFQSASQEIKKTLTGTDSLSADAPRAPNLSPTAQAPGLTGLGLPRPTPVNITRIGAGVAGAAAVTFLVLGLSQAARLQSERSPGVSSWTYDQARTIREKANTRLTISGILAGVSGALLVTSFVLPSEPEPAK